MIRYLYQNVVIWLLHFFHYFLQDCTLGINLISVNWRSEILLNIYFSSAWYINSICYTVGFTSLMTFMWLKNKYQNTSRNTMKIVEHTINIILQHYDRPVHQSQNHSCIWRWKWLLILSRMSGSIFFCCRYQLVF